ncbi:Uncharacterized alpha/beta hydrolase domain [Andreprevotia lacus DSM 23236]|jgi:hypothetical protein|uniref:Uncharacterized alpha/beta hydrolase domain n=1 Tax=Andreprevotia lacus DSM 23236 TaxID=1121001 RepID=A0A1W1Y160_9NEIS|nr:DUF2235 domain-containing protein [Andreprevotia lacus]SMC29950.1 Uncharacterized alpha/beta hydrolase domain [Andreprevotia lacus DSM 23236]
MSMGSGFRWPPAMKSGGRLDEGNAAWLIGKPKVSCPIPLSEQGICPRIIHINLFFDGTNNNKKADTAGGSDTNVARLFDVSRDGDGTHFSYYIPGLGTPFPELAEAEFSTSGKSFAVGFGARALWGYSRVLRALQVALKATMTAKDENAVGACCNTLAWGPVLQAAKSSAYSPLLLKEAAWAAQQGSAGAAIAFAQQEFAIRQQQADLKQRKSREAIGKVYINVFGFSRGSAEARVFVSRLLKKWAPDGLLVKSIPYKVNFVGLFDTVASVGGVESIRGGVINLSWFDGHWGWCADGALDVPTAVTRCVHMIAGHEQRMSFPVDSIREGTAYKGNKLELVYPGVHSDIGGGYPHGDQGKSITAQDELMHTHKLGQITLHDMYIEALEAGVPLHIKSPTMEDDKRFELKSYMEDAFAISGDVISAFNGWIGKAPAAGNVEKAMEHCFGDMLAWRALRAMPGTADYITAQRFFKAAQEDKYTPRQLTLQTERDEQKLKDLRSQRNLLLSARAQYPWGGEYAKLIDKQIADVDAQIKKLELRDKTPLERTAGKDAHTSRPGEGADELAVNDRSDMLQAAEEMRLLMGYLFPTEAEKKWGVRRIRTEVYVVGLTTGERSLMGMLTPELRKETVEELCVVHQLPTGAYWLPTQTGVFSDDIDDSSRVLWLRQSAPLLAALRYDPSYDVLVPPIPPVVGFLKQHTNAAARAALSAESKRLYDDFVHDSRAWFRVPNFHEYAPGGFGWPRVIYQGQDNRMPFLGVSDYQLGYIEGKYREAKKAIASGVNFVERKVEYSYEYAGKKTTEAGQAIRRATVYTADKVKEGASWTADQAKQGANWTVDQAKRGANWTVDQAKQGMQKAEDGAKAAGDAIKTQGKRALEILGQPGTLGPIVDPMAAPYLLMVMPPETLQAPGAAPPKQKKPAAASQQPIMKH